VDVDYMIDDLVRHVRPFNLPALLEASTELHIALADAEDASVHYVDLWEAFSATGALPILYNRFVKVGDRLYLDGSLSDGLSLPRLLSLGCRYVVVVLTKPLSFRASNRAIVPTRGAVGYRCWGGRGRARCYTASRVGHPG
jgi:predicted patatin/cPLA2 family phospholipase